MLVLDRDGRMIKTNTGADQILARYLPDVTAGNIFFKLLSPQYTLSSFTENELIFNRVFSGEVFRARSSLLMIIILCVRGCVKDELISAINTVSKGKKYLSPGITGIVLEDYLCFLDKNDNSIFVQLSRREREVLQLIAEGKFTKQLAGDLIISVKTVETHRQNIMKKLDIYNIPDLVKYAIQQGVIDIT